MEHLDGLKVGGLCVLLRISTDAGRVRYGANAECCDTLGNICTEREDFRMHVPVKKISL